MTTEQDAKSKVHLRLLGRSIGLPSEAREVIEIVWKAAAEFFQAQQPMPAWMQYQPVTDVLTIHGKKYAASLFGKSGFLGNAGDILRIEQGSDDVVTVTKIQPEKADKFATGGLRKNYIPPIPIWTGLGQHSMKRVPPVPSASTEDGPVGRFIKGDLNRAFELYPAGKNLPDGTELYTHPAPAASINEQLLEALENLALACGRNDGWEDYPQEMKAANAAIAAAEADKLEVRKILVSAHNAFVALSGLTQNSTALHVIKEQCTQLKGALAKHGGKHVPD